MDATQRATNGDGNGWGKAHLAKHLWPENAHQRFHPVFGENNVERALKLPADSSGGNTHRRTLNIT